mgnify:CR=1 FL=1
MAPRPTVLSLCSGAGGLDLGLRLACDARSVGYVERDAYAAAVLVARMADAGLEEAPIWDDIATFDGRPWRGVVDIVAAGFPCQPVSVAGKRLAQEDDRWLWPEIARVVRDVAPGWVFLENVRGLLSANDGAAFGEVLGDLARLGFDAEWGVFSAAEVGAPHRRERVFILADTQRAGRKGRLLARRDDPRGRQDKGRGPTAADGGVVDDAGMGEVPMLRRLHLFDTPRKTRSGLPVSRDRLVVEEGDRSIFPPAADDYFSWLTEDHPVPALERRVLGGANGSANRVDRLRLLGNGVVPQQAALAFRALSARFGDAVMWGPR